LKTFLNDAVSTASATSTRDLHSTAPIADLFPNTTILFADIAGFTAWCSEREPTQVFILLETIYCAFDSIAKLNGVFKVETIGDCYVAVTGLPDPQEDHAVIMASFARSCIKKMQKLTKKLEATLGPGTADLAIRIGLHSGPVTAGVLRGDKSRFQLFGDTVNTASRMESNGERDRIHVSEETAMLLVAAGKKHWIKPREDVIVAKGKGNLHTYWLLDRDEVQQNESNLSPKTTQVVQDLETEDIEESSDETNNRFIDSGRRSAGVWGLATLDESQYSEAMDPNKLSRLVDWNVDVLLGRLKAILASRQEGKLTAKLSFSRDAGSGLQYSTPRDEVAEIIMLPDFDPAMAIRKKDPATVEVDPKVVAQLRKYVSAIATMYRSNPFHNFEHASHVSMSSSKLLQRIIAPDDVDYRREDVSEKQRRRAVASDLHDITFGIASDPLTQFAVVFSALIHDVDHSGLSNAQIVQQRDPIAAKYKSKSVAEQNSIDVAWSLLMLDDYIDLRRCIYSNETEAKRFRQLVVNSVVATDLFDAELRTLRINRWEKAFCKRELPGNESDVREDMDRKATTVIEHIIQASDVAHTMQHWHIYQRWNEKLFNEQFGSFQRGISTVDPSMHWYQGELDFFDNYIIPLANKLKESGVFGVSGDEYLIYAQENRKEWALKGEQIVTSWREQLCFDKLCLSDP
jgi:class 3 adenylate cyclase